MKKTNKKGFTIVELVIVIAVIAIVAGVLIPTFTSVSNRAKESAALQKARTAYTAITVYDIDAEQDNEADNEVGENYVIKADDYYFVVTDGELSTTPATATACGAAITGLDIKDLPTGVTLYKKA